jgi:predicted ATP-dependent protease
LLYSSIGDTFLRTDTCITGEISINGDIKSVGGVREKVIAAIREGFAHMIIPKDNTKDALGLEGINIIPVEHIHEIIDFLSVDLMNS